MCILRYVLYRVGFLAVMLDRLPRSFALTPMFTAVDVIVPLLLIYI